MATFKVLLFGPQATLAGSCEVDVTLESATISATDLLDELGNSLPAIQASLATSRLAVNHEFVPPETEINPDSEIALIGMISGG